MQHTIDKLRSVHFMLVIGDTSIRFVYFQSHPEEFASDAFHQGDEIINRESLKTELGQLGVTGTSHEPVLDPSTWEDDLQAELKDLDLQNVEGGELPEDKEAWEAELEQMLDMHSDVDVRK